MAIGPSAVPRSSCSAIGPNKSESVLLASAWRRSLQNLIAETDPKQMLPLLYATENDLWSRWESMAGGETHDAERRAMNSATVKLYTIKTQVLGWTGL